jgi:hypothetical protein
MPVFGDTRSFGRDARMEVHQSTIAHTMQWKGGTNVEKVEQAIGNNGVRPAVIIFRKHN